MTSGIYESPAKIKDFCVFENHLHKLYERFISLTKSKWNCYGDPGKTKSRNQYFLKIL